MWKVLTECSPPSKKKELSSREGDFTVSNMCNANIEVRVDNSDENSTNENSTNENSILTMLMRKRKCWGVILMMCIFIISLFFTVLFPMKEMIQSEMLSKMLNRSLEYYYSIQHLHV